MILKLAQAFALARKYRVELKLMTLPDGGGAPEGRRERKSWQFLPEKFGFSGFSNLARWPRSPANNSEACPISPSAAPPQLPRQEELRPGRAVRRAGAGARRAPLLPERINAFPTRRVHRSARTQICPYGTGRAWPVPYMAGRNHCGAFYVVRSLFPCWKIVPFPFGGAAE